jgi:lipopolysaccharide transport system ATP-binding protein
MSSPAISITGLSKQYRIGTAGSGYQTLRDALGELHTLPKRLLARARTPQQNTFWALDDINFDVSPGEVVGVIGRNGAGKSTLLKILSRITEPTKGRIRIRGRVASLLEVGTGFHAELTGRENLYLNGAILGMTRAEIRQKFDEIVAFAEIEKFIDTPVKRYSSGMYLRLAFAIAAHLEPEILIVDEVLAVGDAAFQTKCIGKMEQVAQQGRTILFVSHNMPSVRSLCSRCVWIQGGKLRYDGEPKEAIQKYLQEHVTEGASVNLLNHPGRKRQSTPEAMHRLTVFGATNQPTPTLIAGEPATFRIELSLPQPIRHPRGVLWITSDSGVPLFMLDSTLHERQLEDLSGKAAIECTLPEVPLMPGKYLLNVGFGDTTRLHELVYEALTISVAPGDFFGVGRLPNADRGTFLVRSNWGLAIDQSASLLSAH